MFESLALAGAGTRVDLAAGVLRDVIVSPKGAFAAIDGADAVADYLTNAGQTTPQAVIGDFRAASAGQRFEDAAQYVRGYNKDLPLLGQCLSQIQMPVLVITGKGRSDGSSREQSTSC
jgi:hypothetical protein